MRLVIGVTGQSHMLQESLCFTMSRLNYKRAETKTNKQTNKQEAITIGEVVPTRYCDELDVELERKRRVKK